MDRRLFLQQSTMGFGTVALAGLLAENASASEGYVSPFTPKPPHHAPQAKRVIFLCMKGGPSHMDMLDYKPKLTQDDGRALGKNANVRLLGSLWKFRQHGQSGLWFSELLPELAKRADDLCVLNGMQTDNPEHAQALDFLHTGSFQFCPSVNGSLGFCTDSVPRTRTCPGSSPSTRPLCWGEPSITEVHFYPRLIREHRSAATIKPLQTSRSVTSRTPGSIALSSAAVSICCSH